MTPLQQKPPGIIVKLFLAFLRLGLTAFGGPAMIAYIHELAVTRKGWLCEESFKQGVAVSQTIPGATAMQVAAYVGLRSGGPWGALAAYIGFGLPAFLLMAMLAALYQGAHELPAVVSLFKGLQVIVIALVANAAFNFGRGTIKIRQDILLGLGVTVFLVLHGNPTIAILVSALLGLPLYRKRAFKIKEAAATSPGLSLGDFTTPLLLAATLLAGMLLLFLVDRRLFDLSVVMTRVDLFAFGGGYGSVPLMFNEVVNTRHWLDSKVFMDGIALGQVTPGPIVITATFVGYLLARLPGALVGTVSIFAPSLILLTAMIPCFDRLQGSLLFHRMMHGVLVSFVGLLLSVTLRFILAIPWDISRFVIVLLALAALRCKMDILWVVLVGSALSVLLL